MLQTSGVISFDASRPNRAQPTRFESLRRLFFASAVVSATRYGVSFDRLAFHLETAESLETSGPARGIRYMDDLVLAVACIDRDYRAWSDFVERYERPLIARLARNIDEIDATILTRRMLVELRRQTTHGGLEDRFSLRRYAGQRSLRSWISDRSAEVIPEALKAAMIVRRQGSAIATRGKTGTVDVRGTCRGFAVAGHRGPVPFLTLVGQASAAGRHGA